MAKQPKKTQTDYTRGGKTISDTSIPLYQQGLTRLSDLTQNPMDYTDEYLNKYYTNTVDQNDFIRDYNRAMANKTAQNYAATQGGYTSAGQRAYMDQQRAYNDAMARLYNQGIANARSMYQGDVANQQNALTAYDTAYGKGKEYSDIEQYNYMVDQINSPWNQIAGVASGAGQVLSTIPTPWTQAIGAGLQVAGNLGSVDSSALGSIGASGTPTQNQWSNIATNVGRGLTGTAAEGGDNWVTKLFGRSGNTNGLFSPEQKAAVNQSMSINPYESLRMFNL